MANEFKVKNGIKFADGTTLTTSSQTNWDSAYTDRLKWDGGSTGLTASTGRSSLGATTVGSNLFTLTNPSAVTFLRINADNTVSTLDAATFRTAIGAGTSSTTGTVTSVSGTGTVSGLSLSGTVTSSGNITLSGTLSVTPSNFASQTANTFLAAPNGATGTPTFRAIVAADIPTLNQNTTGSAGSLSGFTNSNNSTPITGADALTNNGIGYVTSISLFSQTDGAIYAQAYSTSWVHQIYGDYRTGQLAVRGKNNGTWQAWRTIWDSSNLTNLNQLTNGPGYTSNTGTVTSVAAGTGLSGGTITTSGTISLANTTVTAGSYTAANITVDAQGRITAASNGSSGSSVTISDDTTTNATRYLVFEDVTSGTSTSMQVSSTKLTFNPSTGNLTASGNITAYSDERLKTNIETIKNAVEKVKCIRGVVFDRIDTSNRQTGVIAQEVQAVLPEAVQECDDGILSVAYGNLVGLLIEAIKEQDQKISRLEKLLENK